MYACCAQVSRDKLVSLGTCIGKFTHSDKFRLTIGALDILAAHAKFKARSNPRNPDSVNLSRGPHCIYCTLSDPQSPTGSLAYAVETLGEG